MMRGHYLWECTGLLPKDLRDHFGYGLGQWEKELHSNAFFNWPSPYPEWFLGSYMDGSVQNCSNSCALAMELPQFCAKPLMLGKGAFTQGAVLLLRGAALPYGAVNWIQLISTGIFTLAGGSLAARGKLGPWANLRRHCRRCARFGTNPPAGEAVPCVKVPFRPLATCRCRSQTALCVKGQAVTLLRGSAAPHCAAAKQCPVLKRPKSALGEGNYLVLWGSQPSPDGPMRMRERQEIRLNEIDTEDKMRYVYEMT